MRGKSYFNDIVEEEKIEEDETRQIVNRKQTKFLMFKDKNEFNKKPKRNKSQEFIKPCYELQDFGNVSETEEEENSESSNEHAKQ